MKNKAPTYSYRKGIILLITFLGYIALLFIVGNLAFTLISFPIAVLLIFIVQMSLVCPNCGEMVYDGTKKYSNMEFPLYLYYFPLRFFWVPTKCLSCEKEFK